MAGKTEAEKRAQRNYMGKFVRFGVRLEPDKYEAAKVHAQNNGESMNSFVVRAIDETMERDKDAGGETT